MTSPAGASLVVMTSDKPRHRFFANFLARSFPMAGVVSEAKRPRFSADAPLAPSSSRGEEDALVHEHLAGWDAAEKRFFGHAERFAVSENDILVVPRGGSNTPEVFEWVRAREPRYLVLFGTSIIRDLLLGVFGDHVINMHLGLSPYYRGTATNFWPLVDSLPECVGVTIHIATSAVDGGPILRQGRPEMAAGDDTHDIGCKTIIAGAELMAGVIHDHDAGRIAPVPQQPGGKVFRQRDFNTEAVTKLRANFASGMIRDYLGQKAERDAKYAIIE